MARTRKRPYRGSRRIDRSCRNHGSCGWCQGNRTHATAKRELTAKEEMREIAARVICEHGPALQWLAHR